MDKCSIDANIVIDILTGNAKGHRTADEWLGITEFLDDVDNGRVYLVVPSALFVELLPSRHDASLMADLFDVLRRANVEVVDLSVPIAYRVADIRDRSIVNRAKLHTLDAIYVATADMANATTLYTVDEQILKNAGR